MNKLLGNIKASILNYKIIFKLWFFYLIIGSVFRLLYLFIYTDSNIFTYEFINALIFGLRMDTIVFSALWLIFSILYLFNLKYLLQILLTLSIIIYFFIEVSTIFFMDKFVSRPNYLFVEHLSNFNELFTMVFKLYSWYVVVLIIALGFLSYKTYNYFNSSIDKTQIKKKLIAFPIILILLALGTRSSISSSTPNQSFHTYSSSNIHNEIAGNSIFSILYATYLAKKEKNYNYGDLSGEDSIKIIKNKYNIISDRDDLERLQTSSFINKKNIILVMLESFGHKYIGHLGGTKTTPNLDALRGESLYFTNMYAVGTRTSWGVSSILTSLYPIPSREYVKASKSTKNFYTIAKTLKKHNYKNTFLYSGDASFDNMKGFMLSNGYDEVFGKEAFPDTKTKYTWGYCDEDLYDEALKLIDASKDEKFFLTLLTLSSHEPFDYPKDKVKPYEAEKLEGFANSIKYSDYAIGKFIKALKDKGIMKDTVVAFISDHNENPYGNFDVPIDRYKIVGMILSDEFREKGGEHYSKIASQIDFGPTLLDIAGVSATIPSMGSSVLQNPKDSALILAGGNFAYLIKEEFIIFKRKKKTTTYNYNRKKIDSTKENIKDGLSYINGANYLYKNFLYK